MSGEGGRVGFQAPPFFWVLFLTQCHNPFSKIFVTFLMSTMYFWNLSWWKSKLSNREFLKRQTYDAEEYSETLSLVCF